MAISSDDVYRGPYENRVLTDELDRMDTSLNYKAHTNHNHDNMYAPLDHYHDEYYAPLYHMHPISEVNGLQNALDEKAVTNHNHNGAYSSVDHTHVISDTKELQSALDGKAAASHTHANKADLVNGVIPISQIPNEVKEVRIVANIAARNALTGLFAGLNVYVTDASGDSTVNSGGAYYLYDGTNWIKTGESESLDLVLSWANIQGKPSSLPANGGNADTVDNKHASDFATADHTHSVYAATSHSHSQSEVEGLATALSGKAALNHVHAGYAALNHNHDEDYAAADHTHTAAQVGAASTNHTHSGYAATNHTHAISAITGLADLLATSLTGDVKESLTGKSVLNEIKAKDSGIYTFYCNSTATQTPKTGRSWRFLAHKTGPNYGWVMAYSNHGDIFSNYLDNGTWKGWKTIYDTEPEPLWKGAMYMSSPNSTPQTVTPSKKLSECRNGWLLLWSDYDPGAGENDADFVTTMIPKKNPTGGTWGGKSFLCDIPRYVGTDSDNTATEKRIIKPIYVHDDCIKGSYQNASGDRNDVVLRCVYEF